MRTQDPLVVRNRRSHRFAHSPESPIVASGLRPRGWVYFSWDLAPRPTICSIKKQRPTRGERDLTPLPSLRFTPTRIETFPGLLEYSDQLQAVRYFSLNNGFKALTEWSSLIRRENLVRTYRFKPFGQVHEPSGQTPYASEPGSYVSSLPREAISLGSKYGSYRPIAAPSRIRWDWGTNPLPLSNPGDRLTSFLGHL